VTDGDSHGVGGVLRDRERVGGRNHPAINHRKLLPYRDGGETHLRRALREFATHYHENGITKACTTS
jgi:hypothetical protein